MKPGGSAKYKSQARFQEEHAVISYVAGAFPGVRDTGRVTGTGLAAKGVARRHARTVDPRVGIASSARAPWFAA